MLHAPVPQTLQGAATCRKTDGVDYQDYSKAALQQLKTKLGRKRTRDVSVCYERQDAPDLNSELTMRGLTTSVTLSR